MHVALVGFSVSADPRGYADHLSRLANAANLYSLEVIGIGGLHPRDMSFLIDRISFIQKPDLVIFEVLTSSARSTANPTEYIQRYLAQLVSAAAEMGADSAILNLYRDDVDYQRDCFLAVAKELAEKQGVRLIDLAGDAIELLAKVGKANSMTDVVHPKGNLAEVYATRIHEEIVKLAQNTRVRRIELRPRGKVIHVPAGDKVTYLFQRSGLNITCVEIPENECARTTLPSEHNLVGIACLMGPLSGKLRLNLDNNQVVEVLPYDDRCYYERLGFFYFGVRLCGAVEITQLDGIPNVPLFKGEVNVAPRVGRVYGLLVEPLLSR